MTITVLDNMEYGSDAAAQAGYGGDNTAEWLSGWNYRKSITLSRSSGAVTNYQMKLLVGESSGATGENVDCGSHCLSSFNDLRFTKSDGTTLLDYWIESISGTTPNQLATVWVEFDSIGTTDTLFFMYYGNSGASSASNGTNTFLFFDDFAGSSLDTTNNWTVVSGMQSVSSSEVTVSTPGQIESKTTFPVNRMYRSRIKYADNHSMKFGFSTQTDYADVFHGDHPTSNVLNALNRNPYPTQTGVNLGDICRGNTYNIFEIKRNSTSNVVYSINNSNVATISNNVPSGSLPITIHAHLETIITDWVFVSQSLSTEPSWGTWSNEIAYGTPITYSESSTTIEGSYSLKGIASATTSLNKTLTRTISSPINLTGHAYIIGKIRSNRTGSNIKIGFHDSGGTTTEVTPNITSADTWQNIQLDISGVSDANKDAIDQIIITIVNADADNTFYLDNFFAVDATDFAAGVQVSKAVGYAVLYPIANAMNVSKVVAYAVLGPYVEPADSGPMIWIF